MDAPTSRQDSRFCPRVKSLLVFNPTTLERRLYPIRCKCWTCSYCFPKNLSRTIRRLVEGKPTRFLTLTCRPQHGETPLQAYHRVRGKIRVLFSAIRKEFGPQQYAVICEKHKNGFPHWHLLTRGSFVPQRWLSSQWERLTGAFRVDIRRITDPDATAAYCVKYITKGMCFARLDKRFRVVSFSRSYLLSENRHTAAHQGCVYAMSSAHPYTLLARYAMCQVQYADGSWTITPPHAGCTADVFDYAEGLSYDQLTWNSHTLIRDLLAQEDTSTPGP
jgi:hypothetical protein